MNSNACQDAINKQIRTDPFANFLGTELEIIEPGYAISLTRD